MRVQQGSIWQHQNYQLMFVKLCFAHTELPRDKWLWKKCKGMAAVLKNIFKTVFSIWLKNTQNFVAIIFWKHLLRIQYILLKKVQYKREQRLSNIKHLKKYKNA